MQPLSGLHLAMMHISRASFMREALTPSCLKSPIFASFHARASCVRHLARAVREHIIQPADMPGGEKLAKSADLGRSSLDMRYLQGSLTQGLDLVL